MNLETIILNTDEIDYLSEILERNDVEFNGTELIYRVTRDDDTSTTFHRLCDDVSLFYQ